MRWLLLALWLAVQPPILGYWQGDTLYLQITQPGCLTMYGNGIETAILLPDSCNVTSYRLSQTDPDPLLRPWGRVLVLMDSDNRFEITRWVVPSRPGVWIPHITTPDTTTHLEASPILVATWQPNSTLRLDATAPGCIIAQPGNTSTGLCDLVSGPWWGFVPLYGDQGYAASVPGRWYELRDRGVVRARADVPDLRRRVILPIILRP